MAQPSPSEGRAPKTGRSGASGGFNRRLKLPAEAGSHWL